MHWFMVSAWPSQLISLPCRTSWNLNDWCWAIHCWVPLSWHAHQGLFGRKPEYIRWNFINVGLRADEHKYFDLSMLWGDRQLASRPAMGKADSAAPLWARKAIAIINYPFASFWYCQTVIFLQPAALPQTYSGRHRLALSDSGATPLWAACSLSWPSDVQSLDHLSMVIRSKSLDLLNSGSGDQISHKTVRCAVQIVSRMRLSDSWEKLLVQSRALTSTTHSASKAHESVQASTGRRVLQNVGNRISENRIHFFKTQTNSVDVLIPTGIDYGCSHSKQHLSRW